MRKWYTNMRARQLYILSNPYQFFIGLSAFLTSLLLYLVPTALEKQLLYEVSHELAVVVFAVYGLGGLLTTIGMWRLNPVLEAFGLGIIGTTLITMFLAVAIFATPERLIAMMIVLAISISAFLRIRIIYEALATHTKVENDS